MNYDLKALRAATDNAIAAAYKHDWSSRVAVNWGDLCCVSAEHYTEDEGGTGYRVYIEEADPNNPEFREFIREQLAEAGFKDIEVITEW